MRAVVVDTSAVLAVLMNEPEREAIILLTHGVSLLAPATLPWELGNALSAMFKKRRITQSEAQKVLHAFGAIAIDLKDIDVAESVSYAAKHDMYAYDAYVLCCAARYRVPLLTLDKSLRLVAGKEKLQVVEV